MMSSINFNIIVGHYWWYSGSIYKIWKCEQLKNGKYYFKDKDDNKMSLTEAVFDSYLTNHHLDERNEEEFWNPPDPHSPSKLETGTLCHIQ